MTDHIKAARSIWGESAILPFAELERFYAIAYKAGMERAAEIAETCGGTVSMFATSQDARTHNNAVTLCAKEIRAHAQNQPESTHDTGKEGA